MPVSGWILTLPNEPNEQRAALRELGRLPFLELQAPMGPYVAAVMVSDDAETDVLRGQLLSSVAGLQNAELTFASFEDVDEVSEDVTRTLVKRGRARTRAAHTPAAHRVES